MYTLVSAKVKLKDMPGYWEDADLSLKLASEIIEDYRAVVLKLSNNFINGDLYLDFDLIKSKIALNQTLAQYFTSIGNQALPTTTTAPDYSFRYVKFGDALRANYSIEAVSSVYNPELEVPEDDRTDLLLVKEGIDYQQMAQRCLFSVNGLIHLADSTEHGLQIKDGAKSCRVAEARQVGILSFNSIGDIQCLPITDEMIYKPNNITKMKDRVYLNLGMSLQNKSLLLSLGGYLHVLDDVISVIGDGLITIDWQRIPYVERYFDAKDRMDLSSLELSESPNNPYQIAIEEFFSDEVITRYLKLPQSFFIVVDAAEMFLERHQLQQSNLHGLYYTSKEEVDVPIQLALGRVGCYWKRKEHGKWCIYVDDNIHRSYAFRSTNWKAEHSIDNTLRLDQPSYNAAAFMMTIGAS